METNMERTSNNPFTVQQSSHLPPAQPAYVLRGHSAQIHLVHFFRENLRLLSGDADGWVVVWDVPTKRPVAVWQAHKGAVLGLQTWEDDKIITHGRDNKIHVWALKQDDVAAFSTTLPIDDAVSRRKQPWLLHSLTINALNFCSFALCYAPTNDPTSSRGILVAYPGVHDGHISITALPSEARLATITSPKDTNTGMVMAIGLHYHSNELLVLAGYESGHACVWRPTASSQQWQAIYTYKVHAQPVLSLDMAARLGCFYTSSADAVIARHSLLQPNEKYGRTKMVRTKHAGQQSLKVRSDERIFATAGWDGRVRVYSATTMKEMAVLKWHKEGCYALAFAEVDLATESRDTQKTKTEGDQDIVKREPTVSEQRTAKAKTTHWLAAGSKDGKVSLWEIY